MCDGKGGEPRENGLPEMPAADEGDPGASGEEDGAREASFDPDGIIIVKGGTQRPHFANDGATTADGTTATDARSTRDRLYLVVHGIHSKNNVGDLMRTAGAMGAAEVLVVSKHSSKSKAKRSIATWGAHGADRRVVLRAFGSFDALAAWLRRRRVYLWGIEIKPEARSISYPECFARPAAFDGGAAFMPGNEGTGIVDAHARRCDGFVYIPHYGAATASLNVNAATAIVLHAFASSHPGAFHEVPRRGEKFVVNDRPHA